MKKIWLGIKAFCVVVVAASLFVILWASTLIGGIINKIFGGNPTK